MILRETSLPGALIVEPVVHGDARGFFLERYHAERYRAAGLDAVFVQDNMSRSARGTLRGLHFQREHPQGKLVEVVRGAIFDVAVDLRVGSPTFGQWEGVELTEDNHWQFWVPPGFGHGFCVLSETADVLYKCTEVYRPEDEGGVVWDDPELAVTWPVADLLLSGKDLALPQLAELSEHDLPRVSVPAG